MHRTALDLFYAHSLMAYLGGVLVGIRQRERVESKGPVDLKALTGEQLIAEANRAYVDAWRSREALGEAPVAALSEYVEPNDYPKGVRSTLRDAVAYLWVDLLANSSNWRPEQRTRSTVWTCPR